MKTTQHTPLPWRIADSSEIWSGDQPVLSIAHEENSNLSAEEASANQQFIVTACNAHYELLEACKAMLAKLELLNAPGTHDPIEACVYQAKAAITKAQGKE